MKKVALIGGILMFVGLLILCGALWFVRFDFNAFSTAEPVSETTEITESFTSIEADMAGCDLILVPAEDGICTATYTGTRYHSTAKVEEGVLTVECRSDKQWMGVYTTQETLTLCLPQTQYDALAVETASGDVQIPSEFTFGSVEIGSASGDVMLAAAVQEEAAITTASGDIHVPADTSFGSLKITATSGNVRLSAAVQEEAAVVTTSGDVYVSDCSAADLSVSSSSGEICLENVIAEKTMELSATSGDVFLQDSDAAEISVKTTSGDVHGTLLTPKVFDCTATSGEINVPASAAGGTCTVSTTSGDISLRISK